MLSVFIPAKGTSSAISKKNLCKVGDRTLTGHAIHACLGSSLVNRVVLSTDSIDVASELVKCVGGKRLKIRKPEEGTISIYGVKDKIQFVVHWRRPKDATASSPTVDSIIDYLELENSSGLDLTKNLLLLQPTSPFRTLEELDEVIRNFLADPSLPLASVKQIQSPHPLKTFEVGHEIQAVFSNEDIMRLTSPRQQLQKRYAFDGAYYINSVANITNQGALIGPKTRVLFRTGYQTINIDTPEDLLLARIIANQIEYD
jgi:CMP-N-acetylneuraminic acid synthetase